MKFIFTDEQFSCDNIGGEFTAVTAAIFDASCMEDFRREFFREFCKILGRDKSSVVAELPILHGSDLLTGATEEEKRMAKADGKSSEITDEHRLAIYELLFRLVNSYDVWIYRLGYYEKPMKSLTPNLYSSDSQKADDVLAHLTFSMTNWLDCNHVYVHEINKDGFLLNYNDTRHQAMMAYPQMKGVSSLDSHKILGKFYCDKKNCFMYVADLTSHALLKKHKKLSKSERIGKYHNSIVEKLNIIKHKIKYNKLIYARTGGEGFRVVDGRKTPL